MADAEPGQVEELEAEIVDDGEGLGEHDAQDTALREHDQHLGQLIRQGEQAGFAQQTAGLKNIRRALRRAKQHIQEAEQRGYARGQQEQLGDQGIAQLREQVRGELAAETAHARSLDRLGVPEPLRSMFDSISGDHKAYERQAALLHAAGVHWGDADPLVRQIGQQQVSQWQRAAEQNGGAVPLDPAAGVPAAVREQVIAEQVQSMAATQAGAQPVGSDDLATEIQRADPERLGQAGVEDLAARFNREMDALSRARQGLW